MISSIFHLFFYDPLYNALIFVSSVIPSHDLGISIILLTLGVKFVMIPMTHRTMEMQKKMREIEPELKIIKENVKNQEEQAVKIMNLYRAHGIRPISGLLGMLIQIPLLIAMYLVFQKGVDLASPLLYGFTPIPPFVDYQFLGILDLQKASILLAVLAGVLQFIQVKLSIPPVLPVKEEEKKKELSFKEEFAKSLQTQSLYVFPVMIAIISLKLSAALPLFWITNSVFTIGHELIVRKKSESLKSRRGRGSPGAA